MRFGKLILLLMTVLLVQQAQCLAACAVDTCENSLPPCHRQHSDPSAKHSAICSHDAVVSSATQIHIADLPPDAMPPLSDSPIASAGDPPLTIAVSPPGPPLSVLRI